MKKISIITINLNNKDGLRKTAESVVSQTAFSEIEWIVIDGESSDGSLDVIAEFRDKMAYCVSEPDKGIYNAMNKGVRQSNGEYVLFLNSGDFLYSNDVIGLFLNAEEYGCYDYLVGRIAMSRDGIEKGILCPPLVLSGRYLLAESLPHQSEFIRRKRFDCIGYDETYKIAADAKYVAYDVINNNATYSPLNFIVSNYDLSGISSVLHDRVLYERTLMLREVLPPVCVADYEEMIYGKSLLSKVIIKLRDNNAALLLLTFFAIVVFFPVWLFRIIKMKFGSFFK